MKTATYQKTTLARETQRQESLHKSNSIKRSQSIVLNNNEPANFRDQTDSSAKVILGDGFLTKDLELICF